MAIEEFMNIMGIRFERDFSMNLHDIQKVIKNYGYLRINDNIIIKLTNIKKSLRFIPLKSSHNTFSFTHPLGSVKKSVKGVYDIYIGNKRITKLSPQYFEIASKCPKKFVITTQNDKKEIKMASEFFVSDDFNIDPMPGIRVNVIGFSNKKRNESGVDIHYDQLDKRYSIDKEQKIYRVEFYRDEKFCAMNLVHFKKGSN